jgi:hypothetical protein
MSSFLELYFSTQVNKTTTMKANFKTNSKKELMFLYRLFLKNDSPEISEQTKIKIKEYANLKIISQLLNLKNRKQQLG